MKLADTSEVASKEDINGSSSTNINRRFCPGME
jgi:hypothetical protein